MTVIKRRKSDGTDEIVSAVVVIPGATAGSQGGVQLTGDLGGSASSPTVPGLASKAIALTTTSVKTAAYTAGANEIVPVDASSAPVTITFPNAPADKTRLTVKKIDSSTNAVTLNLAGADVFNKTGGVTTGTLSLTNQAISVQYSTTGNIWTVTGDDLPLSQLDARTDAKIAAQAASDAATYVALGPDYLQPILDTTGSADIYTALNAAISALPAAGGIIELPSGSLNLNTALVVSKSNVRIVGRGAGKTNIVLGSAIGAAEGIKFTGTGGRLEHVTVTATASANYTAVRFTAADGRAERIKVIGGASGAARGILGDTAATGLEIVRCAVTGITTATNSSSSGAGIAAFGDDTLIDRCTVSSCTGASTAAYYTQMAGIYLGGTSGSSGRNIRVLQCVAYSNGSHGLYANGCDYLTIDGGTYHDNGALATAAGGSGLTGTSFGRGITIGSSAALAPKIINTTLYNNQENGVIVAGSAASSDTSPVINSIVSNNASYSNNQGGFAGGHGIEVNSTGGTISGNICWGNHNGISVSGVHQTIVGNRCYANTSTDSSQGAGIQLNFGAGTPVVLTCTTTSGSNQITVASGGFPGVVEEQFVSGTGISSGTAVTKISGNTALLGANATASGTVSLTFTATYSRNTVVGNICTRNDNYGIRVIGDAHQGVIISDNLLSLNGIAERSSANYDISVTSNSSRGTYRNNSMHGSSVRVNIADTSGNRGGNMTASDGGLTRSLSYSTSVSWNGESSEFATLTVTDTVAFTVNPPTITFAGRRVTYRIINSSGGTMGTITWGGSFKLAGAFTNPASTKSRLISFIYDGSSWLETSRTASDT